MDWENAIELSLHLADLLIVIRCKAFNKNWPESYFMSSLPEREDGRGRRLTLPRSEQEMVGRLTWRVETNEFAPGVGR